MEKFTTKSLVEHYMFEHNGIRLFLDVKKSNFFELDDKIFCVINYLNGCGDEIEGISKDEFEEIIAVLQQNELLVDKELEVKSNTIIENQRFVNLVLNLCHDCNLRCEYCFANTGNYKGNRNMLEFDIAKKAIDWFVNQSGEENRKLNINFFGGEPTMNLPLLKKIIDYIHLKENTENKEIFMSISTNGTLMSKELIDIIKNNKIGIQISLDGPKDIQDKYRHFASGKGSYDTIVKNLKTLFDTIPKNQIMVRATLPHYQTNINSTVDHLFELGFKMVVFIPAMGCGEYNYKIDDLSEFKNEYNVLVEKFIDKTINNEDYHVFPLTTEVNRIGGGVKRVYGCGAGIGFVAISTNGEIYPCMRFIDNEFYKLGDVFSGVIKEKVDLFYHRTVDNREKCSKCWARYFCGGACIAIPSDMGLSIEDTDVVNCEVAKHVTMLAMYANAKLVKHGINYNNQKFEFLDFMRRRDY